MPSRRLLSPEMLRVPAVHADHGSMVIRRMGEFLTEESTLENNGGATGVENDGQLSIIIYVFWK